MPSATLTETADVRSAALRQRAALPEHEFSVLLSRMRAGNEAAFAVLWRAVNPRIVRYLRVLAREVADDLAADVWLEVARGIARFEGDEAGFRAWVFTIARHRHVDWRRAQARRPRIVEGSFDATTEPDRTDDPAGIVETADATARALRIIERLPPDQAEVVSLRVIADLDVSQVARIVDKRPGTVRVLAHRGLRRLAEIAIQDGWSPDRDRPDLDRPDL
jgi:RNA polymerase sigma-70 factor (ECF subfamily)